MLFGEEYSGTAVLDEADEEIIPRSGELRGDSLADGIP
jgi:hypothetical protein